MACKSRQNNVTRQRAGRRIELESLWVKLMKRSAVRFCDKHRRCDICLTFILDVSRDASENGQTFAIALLKFLVRSPRL